ncbi:hypothetical protein TcasGA2_TC005537 [Tribolium castaneum]|uniref:Uncharacterized protein n=1 Tax=Tribolium castaneum TaxID=7070 RepID=D6WXP0_TRICA|nr:hypothetical protein TcasGA2_TC005537 [Tribolium castaneum]
MVVWQQCQCYHTTEITALKVMITCPSRVHQLSAKSSFRFDQWRSCACPTQIRVQADVPGANSGLDCGSGLSKGCQEPPACATSSILLDQPGLLDVLYMTHSMRTEDLSDELPKITSGNYGPRGFLKRQDGSGKQMNNKEKM